MEIITTILTEALPPGAVVIVGVIIIRQQLKTIAIDVRDIKRKCDERLKFCLGHFKAKD